MKKYIEDLRKELLKQKLTNEEIEDIISDHEEMIQNAIDEGLSEEQIIKKFGEPEQLAKELADFEPKKDAENIDSEYFVLWESFDVTKEELSVLVKLTSEDVIYQPTDASKIQVYYRGTGKINRYNVSFEKGQFELVGDKGLGFRFAFGKNNDISFLIEIPKHVTITEFTNRTVSSDIMIKNLKINQFRLSTTSGDVIIENTKLGDAQWHTVSGDLSLKDSSMEVLSSSQVSGDIQFERVQIEKDVRCNTVSGDFNIEDSKCQELNFSTVSGDLNGKEFYPQKVSLKSISGDLNIKNKERSTIIILKKSTVSGEIDIE